MNEHTEYPGVEFPQPLTSECAFITADDRHEALPFLINGIAVVVLPCDRWLRWRQLVPRDKLCIAEWLSGNRHLAVSKIVAHFPRLKEF